MSHLSSTCSWTTITTLPEHWTRLANGSWSSITSGGPRSPFLLHCFERSFFCRKCLCVQSKRCKAYMQSLRGNFFFIAFRHQLWRLKSKAVGKVASFSTWKGAKLQGGGGKPHNWKLCRVYCRQNPQSYNCSLGELFSRCLASAQVSYYSSVNSGEI